MLVGQEDALEGVLTALLAGGHVLLEGVPGVAKTLLAKLVARSLSLAFRRIQFTPDLMPTDVTGTTVFNLQDSQFHFKPGPAFTHLLLADEINRAPAKTQAALFEVMEERQLSIDGVTHRLEPPFMVLATQNPIEQEGTYQLPEAQLDRFLFRIKLGYPSLEEESDILMRFASNFVGDPLENMESVMSREQILEGQKLTEQVHIEEEVLRYIARLVHRTRGHKDLDLGGSPRASLGVMRAAKARALLQGREFVIPEDVQWALPLVLNHRIMLNPERELDGTAPEEVISGIVAQEEVPR